MAVDPVFKGAGRTVGQEIWRIEKLKVVPLERKKYGKFHVGDSYICLDTKRKEFGWEWNIHFWLGAETTKDEAGVAAYKTVELDDSLGGAPVQHREVQGHESAMFLNYFSEGIEYLPGGVASGFKKVEKDVYEPRLLQVKGRRNIRTFPVRLAWESMNSGDVFILDLGLVIYVWNGCESSRLEKIKGLDVARRIRDEERGGRANIEVMDESAMDAEFVKTMNAIAEGVPKDIKAAISDNTFERKSKEKVKLYRVSDAGGSLVIKETGGYPLKRGMLDTNDAFILDTGATAIYVWMGQGATDQEKKESFRHAKQFIQTKGYPQWCNISVVKEGCEPPLFKQNFSDWLNKDETTSIVKAKRAPGPLPPKFDVKKMHEKGSRESQTLVDDGTGEIEIWRIEDFEMVPLEKGLYGQFFGGDSYVILYTYLVNGVKHYIIYFWQGEESSQDEKGAAALHAVSLDDKYGGAPVQVRVVQNKEPDHFLLIFKGRMIVHSGGRASGFKNRLDSDSYDVDGTRLFHVRGTNALDTRAVQVDEIASNLNSNDCFVLETPKCTYIWYGKGCSGDERQLADSLAPVISPKRETVKITEGSEPQEFWAALGGRAEYASGKWLAEVVPSYPSRLFQCSNASGSFKVEEIFDFAQVDLIEEDVMILDTFSEVFVWIGRGANSVEKKEALKTAKDYITTSPTSRDLDSTFLAQVKQGFEPPTFKCHFLGWNPDLWKGDTSYESYLKQVKTGVTTVAAELKKYDESNKYPYDVLKKSTPEGVDPSCKEVYLSEEEFKEVLKMTTQEFRAMPKWKQNDLKRKVDLY